MSRRVSIGDYHAGLFCGERWLSLHSWTSNPLFRRSRSGFSIGPVLFWKEDIK